MQCSGPWLFLLLKFPVGHKVEENMYIFYENNTGIEYNKSIPNLKS